MRKADEIVSCYAGGIRLVVKAKPGSARPHPPRIVALAEGGQAIEIAVAAPPEDGKANKAIMETLADCLGCKKAALSVKAGTTGRLKIIDIEGDPEVLAKAAQAWLKTIEDGTRRPESN